METQQAPLPEKSRDKQPISRTIQKALESKRFRKQPYTEYRRFIQDHYDGIAGNLTAFTGMISGHAILAGHMFRPGAFDLRGCKRILDAGCGNGRHCRHILRRADPDAFITAFDLSQRMLKRACRSINSERIQYLAADLTRLPYAENHFDAIVCGWVLEHLPDPRLGLKELARILRKGGKMLLMTTEDTFVGAMCSSLWHCRTYNRQELRQACEDSGLIWHRPWYFSHLHRVCKLGGIVVELRRA
jgi:ubiquinone/menaquinone biosynthesis C-methylase UbiE